VIIYRKYGKTVEITKTQKEPSSRRGVSSTRKLRGIINVRRVDSIRRTKRICLRKLLSAFEDFGAPLLITLTFSGSASDVLLSSRRLSYFQRRLQAKFPGSQSLFIPELSPRNRIHYHGLLFGVSQDWGDKKNGKRTVYVGRERKERYFQKLWGYGFVDVSQTDGSPRLGYYLTKYIAKSSAEPFFAPIRLVRSSRGFPKEYELRGPMAEEAYRRYSLKKPDFESEFYTPFLGNIQKRFYTI